MQHVSFVKAFDACVGHAPAPVARETYDNVEALFYEKDGLFYGRVGDFGTSGYGTLEAAKKKTRQYINDKSRK